MTPVLEKREKITEKEQTLLMDLIEQVLSIEESLYSLVCMALSRHFLYDSIQARLINKCSNE